MRRHEMRWEELRWDELSEVWSVKCKCEVWSAGCEECSAKCDESVRLALHCAGSRAGHALGQQRRSRLAQSTHAGAWPAHGACKFYRWKRSYSTTLRQLLPRLVRALLLLMSTYLYNIIKTMSSSAAPPRGVPGRAQKSNDGVDPWSGDGGSWAPNDRQVGWTYI